MKSEFADDKAATSFITGVLLYGVKLESRYDKLSEYRVMKAMVLAIPPDARSAVRLIECDSKAQCDYSIYLRYRSLQFLDTILTSASSAAIEVEGGYNGITVMFGNEHLRSADAWW